MIFFLICIALLCVAAVMEIRREIRDFRVKYYDVSSAKFNGGGKGCRIAFITDLHDYVYGENNAGLTEAVKKEKPDLILIGGDMMVSSKDSFKIAESLLMDLALIAPVWCANGNHEQRMKERPHVFKASYAEYTGNLYEAGVHFLENKSARIYIFGKMIRLTGLEIPLKYYKRFNREEINAELVTQSIGSWDEKSFEILLAHNPLFMESYLERGADLILSGHLHGGIVGTPHGGLITPTFKLNPRYAAGMTREGNKTVIVSRGIGTHTIPIRLFNPAELAVIQIHGEE